MTSFITDFFEGLMGVGYVCVLVLFVCLRWVHKSCVSIYTRAFRFLSLVVVLLMYREPSGSVACKTLNNL